MLSLIICCRTADISDELKQNIVTTIGCEYELCVIDNDHKYLGAEYVVERARQCRKRMSRNNITKGYAVQYADEEHLIEDRAKNKIQSAQMII